MNDSPDKPRQTYQKPVEVIAGEGPLAETTAREWSAGVTRATGVRTKWQGDGTGGSLLYIKFSHSVHAQTPSVTGVN